MTSTKAPGRIVGPHTLAQVNSEYGLKGITGDRLLPRGREADRIKVEPVITTAMQGRWAGEHLVRCLDDGYYLPTLDEVSLILENSRVARLDFVDELFDCDDFAFGVKGELSLYAYEDDDMRRPFAFGIIMGGFKGIGSNHAMCCFVDHTFKMWLVEPRQLDEKTGGPNALDQTKVKFSDPAICYDCYLLLM